MDAPAHRPRPRPGARASGGDAHLQPLIDRAARGDREAFGSLCARYHDELLRFAVRRLPSREDAEDVVQQTYFKALRSIERRDPSRPFHAWLFHIATNVVKDFYRTRKMTAELTPGMGGTAPAADDAVLSEEIDPRLRRALDELTARQRWIVRLRVFDDLGYEEIADRLGCSPGAARALQMRAMHALRASLAGDHERRRSA